MKSAALSAALASLLFSVSVPALGNESCPALLQHTLKRLHASEPVNLCQFSGKTLLIVNTASHCGFTPQFKGLEALYQKYQGRGLEVVGFPSDDFFQESKDQAETASVCYKNFGVTFTMLEPVHVRGGDAHPVFQALNAATSSPKWNFNKYLVDKHGKVLRNFGSRTKPDDPELIEAIEAALGMP